METKPTRDEIVKKILEYFEDDGSLFSDCLEELDGYAGILSDDDRFYSMDEIDELFSTPSEALTRAYYGHDGEVYSTDANGTRHYGEFCPYRIYFKFDGYGNLVSYDYKDYSDHLDADTINAMQDYRSDIPSIDDDLDLSIMFDDLDAFDAGIYDDDEDETEADVNE